MRTQWLLPLLFGIACASSSAADDGWSRQLELGRSLARQGRYQEAITPLERARSQAVDSGSGDGEALALNDLGAVYIQLHDLSAGERCLRRSATIWGQRSDPHVLAMRINLAVIYLRRRQYRTAEALLKETYGLAEHSQGPGQPVVAAILAGQAEVALGLRNRSRAATLCMQALEILRQNGDPDHIFVSVLESLGVAYRSEGKIEEAAPVFAQAREILEGLHAPAHPAWILIQEDQGGIELARGHYTAAENHLQQALTLAENALGPEHPTVGRVLHEYSVVLRKAGRKSEAKKLMDRATRIERQGAREDGSAYTVDLSTLSGLR